MSLRQLLWLNMKLTRSSEVKRRSNSMSDKILIQLLLPFSYARIYPILAKKCWKVSSAIHFDTESHKHLVELRPVIESTFHSTIFKQSSFVSDPLSRQNMSKLFWLRLKFHWTVWLFRHLTQAYENRGWKGRIDHFLFHSFAAASWSARKMLPGL